MASTVPVVAVRGSTGILVNLGPPSYDLVTAFQRDDSRSCKCMQFSPDGKQFAWVNGKCVKVVSTSTWKVTVEIERPKVSCLQFSPKGTYLMTWEPYTTTTPQQSNLYIFKAETGEVVKDFFSKKQTGWEPRWSDDEKLCARHVNNEVHFYEDSDFTTIKHRLKDKKIANFFLSPSVLPYLALCYMPGTNGQPGTGRLYQYPKFEAQQALASKSFFQADDVDLHWNQKGNAALLMTTTDVDKSNNSYYGKQALHFFSTQETAMVTLSKKGPIYSVAWSPKSTEFTVSYGFMPSKVTVFNLKCEPIFEVTTGSFNAVYYNPMGNILLIGGFGNISKGPVELWNMTTRKTISKLEAPDTTLLQWSPDGEHFMTATTAPRLREGNGFKIWHYSGALMYERPWNKLEELWEVRWQEYLPGVFKEPVISAKQVEGIQPSQSLAYKQVYRPPSARGQESTFKVHAEESSESTLSPNALKLKKKREAKKAKKALQQQEAGDAPKKETPKPAPTNGLPAAPAATENEYSSDPEKNKKAKKIKGKLDQINKLKEQLASGRQLEKNQLEKINKEDDLLREFKELTL